ncbi:hypothetical protein DPMN_147749 [Dreissena polymorpha]|uniref:Uncharacterized protein n=1 Tax=Dreissena polymorpha TaxID=45954 RepID=A0A9D4FB58_DREPO|nr:hypothetical protein DPMN_147749 [Dreissena polymorpha]
MFLGFGVSLILGSLCYVDCLTCLQCLNIESPRHCRHVKECSPSEVCYVNQKVDEYGDVLFDIGCKNASRCSNSSHGSHACDYCCNGSLCNAAGCGQPGRNSLLKTTSALNIKRLSYFTIKVSVIDELNSQTDSLYDIQL